MGMDQLNTARPVAPSSHGLNQHSEVTVCDQRYRGWKTGQPPNLPLEFGTATDQARNAEPSNRRQIRCETSLAGDFERKMMDPEIKQQIDNMTHEEMASMWRFSPAGSVFFTPEYSPHFLARFKSLGGWTTKISKRIGWG